LPSGSQSAIQGRREASPSTPGWPSWHKGRGATGTKGPTGKGVGWAQPGTIVLVDARTRHSGWEGKLNLDMRVPAMPKMVSEVREALRGLPLPKPMLDDARLLVSELVTNSIRHAGLRPEDRVRVQARWSGATLRVDVLDRRGEFRPYRVAGAIRPSPGAESGWGLYLVERLATRWGWGRDGYWFELQLADPTAAQSGP
jgi:anti-sigma regulatory factor (Ser/Thr protein kinase)